MSEPAAPSASTVWSQFFGRAVVWLVPALVLLPVYLGVLLISMVGEDATLLEPVFGTRRGFHGALALWLLVAAGVVGWLGIRAAQATADYIQVAFAIALLAGAGVFLAVRELRHLSGRDPRAGRPRA